MPFPPESPKPSDCHFTGFAVEQGHSVMRSKASAPMQPHPAISTLRSLCPAGPTSPLTLEGRRPKCSHQPGAVPSSPVPPGPPGSSAHIIRLY